MLFCFGLLMALVIYGLMGLTPMIPKRLFLPVTLFNPLAALVVIRLRLFLQSDSADCLGHLMSQVILCLGPPFPGPGGFKLRWPLVPEKQLWDPRFSWLNLSLSSWSTLSSCSPLSLFTLPWRSLA